MSNKSLISRLRTRVETYDQTDVGTSNEYILMHDAAEALETMEWQSAGGDVPRTEHLVYQPFQSGRVSPRNNPLDAAAVAVRG